MPDLYSWSPVEISVPALNCEIEKNMFLYSANKARTRVSELFWALSESNALTYKNAPKMRILHKLVNDL